MLDKKNFTRSNRSVYLKSSSLFKWVPTPPTNINIQIFIKRQKICVKVLFFLYEYIFVYLYNKTNKNELRKKSGIYSTSEQFKIRY